MVQAWKTSSDPEPTGSTGGADRFADHTAGINTAVTHYYGTTDPSSGASWAAPELGIIWYDSNNALGAGGDDLLVPIPRPAPCREQCSRIPPFEVSDLETVLTG